MLMEKDKTFVAKCFFYQTDNAVSLTQDNSKTSKDFL